jgi:hypothetical protein
LTTKEISIFSNSSHLEWRVELSDTILKWDYPRTIPARLGLIWFSGFTGKDLTLNQIKANLAGMVLGWSPFNIVPTTLHSIQNGCCY